MKALGIAFILVVSLAAELTLSSCGGSGGGTITTPPPAPGASLSPASLSFGNQILNTASTAQTITLSNTGNAALNISGIAVVGANAAAFAETNNCAASLAAGANCTISVTFKPTAAGALSASVTVTDNASGSQQSAALTGTGLNPAPTATLTASSATATQFQPITLTVMTTNATSCTASASPADSAWTGAVTCNGAVIIQPTATGTVTYSISATGAGGTITASATVTIAKATPVSVLVSPATSSITTTGTVGLSARVSNGTGNATVAWSVSPSVGAVAPSTGPTTTYTPPATLTTSPTTVTVTATATDATGTATSTATITITRAITLTIVPRPNPTPNNELYSDFGAYFGNWIEVSCTGCLPTDTMTITNSAGGSNSYTISQIGNPFYLNFNSTGSLYVPVLFKWWVSGTDGVTSNSLWITFDGSENIATEDTASGEIYYYYSGSGTAGSNLTMKFKQDGTADGTIVTGGYGMAVDNQTHDLIGTNQTGINLDNLPDGNGEGVNLPNNTSPAYALAASAAAGLGCATQPNIDSVSCFTLPTSITQTVQPFQLPGIPSGSAPAAVLVVDSTHVVVYGRGDQTLRWYTISGTTATAAGTLQLPASGFTLANASYWSKYAATGGWDLVNVNGTLGVMGQLVNADGTVTQDLALVGNATQTLNRVIALPPGTIHIAADPTNGAVVAEYPDFTATPQPITRFLRVNASTGVSTPLVSTSSLVPGAGFLVTNDGSHIAVFVNGKADFQPNQ